MAMCVPGPIAPERQRRNWKSSHPDFKVHVPAATAWTRELTTDRNGCQNSLLTVTSCADKFCSSIQNWHKDSIWGAKAQGSPALLEGSVAFKAEPTGTFPNLSPLYPARRRQATECRFGS